MVVLRRVWSVAVGGALELFRLALTVRDASWLTTWDRYTHQSAALAKRKAAIQRERKVTSSSEGRGSVPPGPPESELLQLEEGFRRVWALCVGDGEGARAWRVEVGRTVEADGATSRWSWARAQPRRQRSIGGGIG